MHLKPQNMAFVLLVISSGLPLCSAKCDILKPSPWKANISQSLVALRGSCVVIPCTFEYHCSDAVKQPQFNALWWTKEQNTLVYSSRSTVANTYVGRTHLLGNLANRSCDLRIDNFTESDKGPFYFRIEAKCCNYSFTHDLVKIEVKDKPFEPVIEVMGSFGIGENITATCSVSLFCKANSPSLKWSHNGTLSQPEFIEDSKDRQGITTYRSKLTYLPGASERHHRLTCFVKFSGHEELHTTKDINLKYQPVVNNTETACHVEASNYHCRCVVGANPPAEVEWILPQSLEVLSIQNQTTGFESMGTLQIPKNFTGTVFCHAKNEMGSVNIHILDGEDTKTLYLYIILPVILIIILALTVLLWACICRTKKSKLQTNRSDIPLSTNEANRNQTMCANELYGNQDNCDGCEYTENIPQQQSLNKEDPHAKWRKKEKNTGSHSSQQMDMNCATYANRTQFASCDDTYVRVLEDISGERYVNRDQPGPCDDTYVLVPEGEVPVYQSSSENASTHPYDNRAGNKRTSKKRSRKNMASSGVDSRWSQQIYANCLDDTYANTTSHPGH